MPPTPHRAIRTISQCELFRDLSPSSLRRLAEAARPVEFRRRQRLFAEGTPGRSVFLLERGSVQLTKAASDGSDVVVRTVRTMEMFAEVILFESDSYPATATALSPVQALAFDRRDFLRLLDEHDFRNDFMRMIMQRLRYLAGRVRYMAAFDLEQRFLLFVREQYGELPSVTVTIPKKNIAAAIGATPETFSRLIRRMTEARAISWKGRVLSVSSAAWRNIGDAEP
ncbi:MAG: Crp/Fnr family transcriptional regulator [Lentisphaerae bacterium]|nr:Crp/Fnr family transcriptional regulator [Lentisphaerota bacterium]